jgi:hypothetical protein
MGIHHPPAPNGPQQQQQQQQQQQGASVRTPYAPPIDPAAAPGIDAGTGQDGSAASTPISTSSRGGNSGSVLLAALQNSSRDNAAVRAAGRAHASEYDYHGAAGSSSSSAAAQGSSSGAGKCSGAGGSSSAAVTGRVDHKGIYLQGIPPDTTKEELEAMFAAHGKVVNVMIIGVKWHATKCAFINYADAAAAQKVGSWHGTWLIEMACRAIGCDHWFVCDHWFGCDH